MEFSQYSHFVLILALSAFAFGVHVVFRARDKSIGESGLGYARCMFVVAVGLILATYSAGWVLAQGVAFFVGSEQTVSTQLFEMWPYVALFLFSGLLLVKKSTLWFGEVEDVTRIGYIMYLLKGFGAVSVLFALALSVAQLVNLTWKLLY